jgi:hypothetical protein
VANFFSSNTLAVMKLGLTEATVNELLERLPDDEMLFSNEYSKYEWGQRFSDKMSPPYAIPILAAALRIRSDFLFLVVIFTKSLRIDCNIAISDVRFDYIVQEPLKTIGLMKIRVGKVDGKWTIAEMN